MTFLFLLVIVAVIGFRLTSGRDRADLLKKGAIFARELIVIAREEYAKLEPFRAALRARTRYVVLAPMLAALSVGLFAAMLFGRGALADPAALVGWGANFGPRTTNGEWWRLLTATFVHVGIMRMIIETAALVQLAMLLERLAGRAAVAAVFCLATALAGLINVSAYPMAVTGGSAGAIFGLYGLLLASLVHGARAGAAVPITPDQPAHEPAHENVQGLSLELQDDPSPIEGDGQLVEDPPQPVILTRAALMWLVPAAVLFLLSALSDAGFVFKADCGALVLGIIAGLAFTTGIRDHAPNPKHLAVTTAVLLAAVVGYAIPMRGIADVRPEIAHIIALEEKLATVYQTASERVRKGAMTPVGIAQVIERTIVPELDAADAHLRSIRGVPPEHQPLVADADEYLRLRSQSWRLYAEDWRNKVKTRRREADGTLTSDATWRQVKAQFRADAATRGKAEGTERASLEVLQRLKTRSS